MLTDGGTARRKDYYLSEKSADAVLAVFKAYHVESECQTGKKLKSVRFDQGKEFVNAALRDYCQEHGIVIHTTTPYAHASNGVAERSNRTILEGVRTVLSDSGLPPSLWAEAAAYGVYTRNLIPSSRHPDKIPAQEWDKDGKRQNVSHLRPFGSTAYAKIPTEIGASKLDRVSIKYSLIGYYGRDGYKLYDRNSGSIIRSRDVIFEEGPGHRTLTQLENDENNDEHFDVFPSHDDDLPLPTGTDVANAAHPANVQDGHMIHPSIPLAPRPRATDVPHVIPVTNGPAVDTLARPMAPAAAPVVPDPPRRSARTRTTTDAMRNSLESEKRLAAARASGRNGL